MLNGNILRYHGFFFFVCEGAVEGVWYDGINEILMQLVMSNIFLQAFKAIYSIIISFYLINRLIHIRQKVAGPRRRRSDGRFTIEAEMTTGWGITSEP